MKRGRRGYNQAVETSSQQVVKRNRRRQAQFVDNRCECAIVRVVCDNILDVGVTTERLGMEASDSPRSNDAYPQDAPRAACGAGNAI